jgi:hypothetical protein
MPPDRLRRLSLVARLSAAACLAMAALPFVVVPLVWLNDAMLAAAPDMAGAPLPSAPFRTLGILASLLPALPMVWRLWRLRQFFRRLASGDVLAAAGARDLRAFGLALLARVALTPLAGAGASVAASWERGAGARRLALRVGDGDLALLLVAAVVTVAAWALAEAAEIADEYRLIV